MKAIHLYTNVLVVHIHLWISFSSLNPSTFYCFDYSQYIQVNKRNVNAHKHDKGKRSSLEKGKGVHC